MKQVIRKGLSDVIVGDVPVPVVIPHHVLICPLYSLISSGTETASIHQEGVLRAVADNPSQLRKVWEVLKVAPPLRAVAEIKAKLSEYAVLGYSGAGVIVDKHSTVRDLEIGDRVAYGGEGSGHAETILAGQNLVVKVPESLPFEHACFATLGSIALNSVRVANISLGEKVAVIGLGLVGQLVAQLAKLQGGVVIALDLKCDRVDLARRLGAEYGWEGGSSVREAVNSVTEGKGADCVIIAAAAKSDAPCGTAIDICRDRGRIVDVGAVDLKFPWYEMYRKEIQFYMARAYGPGSYDSDYEERGRDYPFPYVRWTENRNMEEFLRLASHGQVQIQPLITHEFPLEDAPKAFQTIMGPASDSLAVILKYPAAEAVEPVVAFKPNRRVQIVTRVEAQPEIGVAAIGAGNLARWVHLPNLKKIPNVALRAVYSANGVRGKSYGLRFGAEYCCTEYSEILSDSRIQVVLILSRNQHHAPQALAALRSGKHVFAEKPMALTIEECRLLCQAVDETGKQLTVGFNRRFAPYYVELKKQLTRRVGPAVLNCRVNSPGISGSYWMADPSIGGAILGEACHFVDLMYWLLEAEPISVSAFSLPLDRKDVIGENNLVASFRFADGSVGNLTYCTVGSRTSGGERVEAFAPGVGVVSEDFKRLAIRTAVARKRSRWFAEKGYADQLQSFFAGLRSGQPPIVSVHDGARATIVCLRMIESARALEPRATDWEADLR